MRLRDRFGPIKRYATSGQSPPQPPAASAVPLISLGLWRPAFLIVNGAPALENTIAVVWGRALLRLLLSPSATLVKMRYAANLWTGRASDEGQANESQISETNDE